MSGANSQEPEWGILEMFGHVRLAGRVSEVERFGTKMGRIDVPDTSPGAAPDAVALSQYFGGGSVYRYTPCTEETARRVAAGYVPPTQFQLPPARDESATSDKEDGPTDVDDEDDVIPY